MLDTEIVDEYGTVLQRMGLQNEKEIPELFKIFAEGFHLVFTTETPQLSIVKDNPDDNKFIECAVELEAQYIISGDKHLQNIKKYMGIEIVSPREFWDLMNG